MNEGTGQFELKDAKCLAGSCPLDHVASLLKRVSKVGLDRIMRRLPYRAVDKDPLITWIELTIPWSPLMVAQYRATRESLVYAHYRKSCGDHVHKTPYSLPRIVVIALEEG
jgi:hypothetical protein